MGTVDVGSDMFVAAPETKEGNECGDFLGLGLGDPWRGHLKPLRERRQELLLPETVGGRRALLVHSRDVRADLIDALHAHADGRDHQAGAG